MKKHEVIFLGNYPLTTSKYCAIRINIELRKWQDGELTNAQFKECLNKYWDRINK